MIDNEIKGCIDSFKEDKVYKEEESFLANNIKNALGSEDFFKLPIKTIQRIVEKSELCEFESLKTLVRKLSEANPEEAPLILNSIKFNSPDLLKCSEIIACLNSSPFCNHIGSIVHKFEKEPEVDTERYIKENSKLKKIINDGRDEICDDLFVAVNSDNLPKIKFIIAENPEKVNVVDRSGNNMLHHAVKRGFIRIVKYLIEDLCFDVNSKGNGNFTPLHVAAHMGNIEVIKYLATREDINYEAEDASKRTPLLAAVQEGKTNVVKYLIECANVNANATDKYEQNALQIAVNNDHFETLKYLIDTGKLDINHRDADDYTPLTDALKYCLKFVRYIKKSNGEIRVKDYEIATQRRNMLNKIISIYMGKE